MTNCAFFAKYLPFVTIEATVTWGHVVPQYLQALTSRLCEASHTWFEKDLLGVFLDRGPVLTNGIDEEFFVMSLLYMVLNVSNSGDENNYSFIKKSELVPEKNKNLTSF